MMFSSSKTLLSYNPRLPNMDWRYLKNHLFQKTTYQHMKTIKRTHATVRAIALAGALIPLLTLKIQALELGADLNDETFKLQIDTNRGTSGLGIYGGLMLTDDRGEVFALGAHSNGRLGNSETIRGGFGGRIYYGSPDQGDSFQALALGGELSVGLAGVPGLSFGADLYYAPGITVTDDIDSFYEFTLRAYYQVFENASLYLGVRDVEADTEGGDYNFDDGLHIGFSLDL